MSNQFQTAFETDQLVALFMVHAQKNTISSTDLYKFSDFLSKKFFVCDMKRPQNKRFNCIFLYSDFHLRNLNSNSKTSFNVSKKDANEERQISCSPEDFENLGKTVLSRGLFQNPEFAKIAGRFAQEYMQKQHIIKPQTKRKNLTQEQDDQRWYDYFGK